MCDKNKILINTKKIIRSIKIKNQFALFKIKKIIQVFFEYEFTTKKKTKNDNSNRKKKTQRRKMIKYYNNAFK